jgi:hypothetical protein
MDEPVGLTIARNESEAQLIRGLLESEGIQSFDQATNYGAGVTDGFTFTGPREIFVLPADLERAKQLLEDTGE